MSIPLDEFTGTYVYLWKPSKREVRVQQFMKMLNTYIHAHVHTFYIPTLYLIVASVRDYIQKGASMADTLEVEMIAEPHCVHVHHWEIMYIHNTCTYMFYENVKYLYSCTFTCTIHPLKNGHIGTDHYREEKIVITCKKKHVDSCCMLHQMTEI